MALLRPMISAKTVHIIETWAARGTVRSSPLCANLSTLATTSDRRE